jgi:hypothetical protein
MPANRICSVRNAPLTANKDSPAYPLRPSRYSAGSMHPSTAVTRASLRVESDLSLRSGGVLLHVFAGVASGEKCPGRTTQIRGASVDELADSVTKVVERRLSGRLPWGR